MSRILRKVGEYGKNFSVKKSLISGRDHLISFIKKVPMLRLDLTAGGTTAIVLISKLPSHLPLVEIAYEGLWILVVSFLVYYFFPVILLIALLLAIPFGIIYVIYIISH